MSASAYANGPTEPATPGSTDHATPSSVADATPRAEAEPTKNPSLANDTPTDDPAARTTVSLAGDDSEREQPVDAEEVATAVRQAEWIMGGAKENGYTRTLIEGDYYPVIHPMEVEWAILESLRREGVDVDTDERFSLAAIRSLAGAIATVCDDMDCVIEALATGFLETRWRPDRVGPAGECGWAQQIPAYAYELPEFRDLNNRERCRLLQEDHLVAVRQWYQKREYWESRKGNRWPCYYNAGYICTANGQFYMQNHRRYYQMYEGMLERLVATDEIN